LVDVLAALRWLAVLELMSLAGLPLARKVFARSAGRGYAFARPLALMLATYTVWLLGTFGFLRLRPTSLLFALALVFAIGRRWGGRLAFKKEDRRAVLRTEAVFLTAYVVAVWVRAYNPEIAATEKPMEFAFLNAILRSEGFPPHDPWLAGYALSYYYFGYLMMAALARLGAVSAARAFNLGIATLFALTVTGAYAIVRDMVAHRSKRATSTPAPTLVGIGGGVALAVMGNLEGFLEVLHSRGVGPASFWRWLDIKDLLEVPVPSPGSWVPQRYLWWWRASRVINDRLPSGEPVEVIDEFPAFSFVLGDMHPHVLALPFVLLAIALCFEWALRLRSEQKLAAHKPFLLLATVALGGLGFLNTWDWPIYLALFAAVTGLMRTTKTSWRWVSHTLGLAVAMAAGGFLAYLPFYLSFKSQAGGILPTLMVHTKLRQFIVMFGPFLFVAVFFVFSRFLSLGRLRSLRLAQIGRIVAWWVLLMVVPFLFLGVIGFGLVHLPAGQELAERLRSIAEVREAVGEGSSAQIVWTLLLRKVCSPWMLFLVTGTMAGGLAVLEAGFRARSAGLDVGTIGVPGANVEPQTQFGSPAHGEAQTRTLSADFATLLIVIGLALTWAVEFVYLRDYFGTRMNTVFKFYYQAWVLLAIGCSYGVYHLWGRLQGVGRWAFASCTLGLFLMGLVYFPLAVWTKTGGLSGEPTLDGTLYLKTAMPADYEAIRWLNENVRGAPVILEASGGSYTSFARFSANTGLPTLLGWDFHEIQWRGTMGFQERQADVRRLYVTRSWEEAEEIMDRYGVRYVCLGELERQAYGPRAGELLAQRLPVAYECQAGSAVVAIYERY